MLNGPPLWLREKGLEGARYYTAVDLQEVSSYVCFIPQAVCRRTRLCPRGIKEGSHFRAFVAIAVVAVSAVQAARGPRTSLNKRWCGFEPSCPCQFDPKIGNSSGRSSAPDAARAPNSASTPVALRLEIFAEAREDRVSCFATLIENDNLRDSASVALTYDDDRTSVSIYSAENSSTPRSSRGQFLILRVPYDCSQWYCYVDPNPVQDNCAGVQAMVFNEQTIDI
ncbi:hypothetical protein FB451DRAFT_1185843 [Mycena latifolia]|nr:hypothetical protein FB451DRAFT_1185843 [Mycena latifolia]